MNIKNIGIALLAALLFASCAKDATVNPDANNATIGLSTLNLTNRITSNFVIDSSTIPGVATTVYPINTITGFTNFNRFRRIGTYDTTSTANRPVAYNVGDSINIVAYVKGDDSAMAKRKVNFRFFKAPSAWVTPTAALGNVMFAAENAYRGFIPATADILNTSTMPGAIAPYATAPFTVTKVASENNNGINVSTYVVAVGLKIPATFTGQMISVNFTTNLTSITGEVVGNVNWPYAFRVR
jgi:hypothetical protein